jgi:hypothetical protein
VGLGQRLFILSGSRHVGTRCAGLSWVVSQHRPGAEKEDPCLSK